MVILALFSRSVRLLNLRRYGCLSWLAGHCCRPSYRQVHGRLAGYVDQIGEVLALEKVICSGQETSEMVSRKRDTGYYHGG